MAGSYLLCRDVVSEFYSLRWLGNSFVWNRFVAKIILITQKYLFGGYSKWLKLNHTASLLNRGLSFQIWYPRNANHVKFTVEMCDVYGEADFSPKVSTEDKQGFAATSLSEMTVRRIETYWYSGIENVPVAAVSKRMSYWQSSILISLKRL